MAEPQKRKALESPSIDGREVCTKHTAKVEGMKHITKEQYLRLVDDRVAIPLRLQVEDASEGAMLCFSATSIKEALNDLSGHCMLKPKAQAKSYHRGSSEFACRH